MVKMCCVCKQVLGEIAPVEDMSITHGYCDQDLAELEKEVNEFIKGAHR